jgi:FkbM family methyltransferase
LSPGIVGTLYKGTHEAEELEVVLAHLVPGDRVLELGAGIGLVTIACCQRIGAANVHAFEPNPALAPLIARNFAANGVAPHFTSALVASHAGTGVLHVPEHFTGARAGGDAGARALPAGTRAVPVPAVALAALLAESRPTVLVCDIEGGEVELLCGSDLAGVERIAMEVHPEIVGDAATSALIHHLLGLGFTLALSAQRGHTLLFARPPAPQDMAPPQVLA